MSPAPRLLSAELGNDLSIELRMLGNRVVEGEHAVQLKAEAARNAEVRCPSRCASPLLNQTASASKPSLGFRAEMRYL